MNRVFSLALIVFFSWTLNLLFRLPPCQGKHCPQVPSVAPSFSAWLHCSQLVLHPLWIPIPLVLWLSSELGTREKVSLEISDVTGKRFGAMWPSHTSPCLSVRISPPCWSLDKPLSTILPSQDFPGLSLTPFSLAYPMKVLSTSL